MANANQNYLPTNYCKGKEKVEMPLGEKIWLWPNKARKVKDAIWNGLDPYIMYGIRKPNVPQNKVYCK